MALSERIIKQSILAAAIGTALGCLLGSIAVAAMILHPVVLAALTKPPAAPSRPIAYAYTPTAGPTETDVPEPTDPPPTHTPIPKPTRTATLNPLTPLPTRTPGPSPTRTAAPTRTPRAVVEHFLVGRPVAANAAGTVPTWIYLYGTTMKGDLDVHHGEEFENPVGTPLYAVANGTVVVAGGDNKPVCGDAGKSVCGRDLSPEFNGFYGKLVVIRLEETFGGRRVYALYGHMSKVTVNAGDIVNQGDPIGEVGGSGVAQGGPHLHFEIRLDTNDYAHTRNPILWMAPASGRGSLAGRYTDMKGNLIRGAIVDVYRGSDNKLIYETETYGHDRWPDVNSDDQLGENFGIGDVPVGDYIVRIQGQSYATRVTISEGRLTFIEMGGP